jgi:DNA transformation protein
MGALPAGHRICRSIIASDIEIEHRSARTLLDPDPQASCNMLADMTRHDEFVEYLLELMQPLGPVSAKAMFGGYGIYIDDLMFALVADDVLYFKTGINNLQDYERNGLPAFSYERNNKVYNMSYNEAPADVMDDVEAMQQWASKAIAAALQARKNGSKHTES